MPGKCSITFDTRQAPTPPLIPGQYVPYPAMNSYCRCSTHMIESPPNMTWGPEYCPVGELEARIEYVEKTLGIDHKTGT